MPDLVNVTYAQTGKSLAVNRFGMREMQERVYAERKMQYLLIKALPVIESAVTLLINGEIVNYCYDAEMQEIVPL